MLTRDALDAAFPLAERLDANKVILIPIEGGPLAQLVQATRSDNGVMIEDSPGNMMPDIDYIDTMANMRDEETGINYHDMALDEAAAVAIPAVQEHVAFARSVVAPVVDDLVTRTAASLSQLNPTVLSGAEVVIEEIPAALTNAAFDSLVRKFESTPYMAPPLVLNLPDLGAAEIKELLKTGSGSVDNDVLEWAASKGDAWLIELWEDVFQIRPRDSGGKISFFDFMEDKECADDYALGIFLLARSLQTSPLENTQMDLRAYEKAVADFRDQAAAKLCRELDRIDRNRKNKLLVVKFERLKTTVNGDIYREWIEAGGENEVLFGNTLARIPEVTVNTIDARAAEFKDAWLQHCGLVTTMERNQMFNRTKEFLKRHFRDQITEAQKDEGVDLGNSMQVLKRFDEELDKVREDDLKNLYTLSLKLVCCARFPHKAAFEILSGIDRNVKENPHLDVREAAMLAVLEYICCWLASQVKVVPL